VTGGGPVPITFSWEQKATPAANIADRADNASSISTSGKQRHIFPGQVLALEVFRGA
jgi:hypothetical protein